MNQTLNFFPNTVRGNMFLDVVLRTQDADGNTLDETRVRVPASRKMVAKLNDDEISITAGPQLKVVFRDMPLIAPSYSNSAGASWWFTPVMERADRIGCDEFLGNLK